MINAHFVKFWINLLRSLFTFDITKRKRIRYFAMRHIGIYLGFSIQNPYVVWMDEIPALNQKWFNVSGSQRPFSDRQFLVYSLSKALAVLEGDTAECGVYQGASSFLMCLGSEEANKKNYTHHVFDSFQGLSEPSDTDLITSKDTESWQKGDLVVTLDQTQNNLRQFSNVQYYKGWIPERFSEVKERQFSFVHIDVDLYQPTLDSLEFFYDRMVKGGIILCDDYGSSKCPGAKRAFDDFVVNKPERFVIHVPSGQGFIIKF